MSEIVIPCHVKNLMGKEFGRLTVIAFDGIYVRPTTRSRGAIWKCRCKCGKEHSITAELLKSGLCPSCGCFRADLARAKHRTHGQSRSPEFNSWQLMQDRCFNPKNKKFKDYGGRGITIFDGWLGPNGFAAFFDHVGQRPTPKHTIDRHPDNNGNYEPGNVRWATRREQARNTRRNAILTLNGEAHSIAEWSEIRGIPQSTISFRKQQGFSDEHALFQGRLKWGTRRR